MTRILVSTLAVVAVAASVSVVRAATGSGTVVKAAYNTDLKATILVTSTGLTLYEYLGDDPAHQPYPNCRNDPTYHCTKYWPPLMTEGAPVAGKGVQSRLLGTVKRPGGAVQVTYAGHPLYRFGDPSAPHDRKPGDVYGQQANYLWYVLAPSGKPIKKPR
jgi:predicted lipoprotein with Yx(FWY)xxD motif